LCAFRREFDGVVRAFRSVRLGRLSAARAARRGPGDSGSCEVRCVFFAIETAWIGVIGTVSGAIVGGSVALLVERSRANTAKTLEDLRWLRHELRELLARIFVASTATVETWREQAQVHETWTLAMANPDSDFARETGAKAARLLRRRGPAME
jgi:hypothetical protein